MPDSDAPIHSPMRSFFAGLSLLLLGATLGAGGLWFKLGPNSPEAHRRDALLQMRTAENDRLRALVAEQEHNQAAEKNKAARTEIEHQVAEIRGLSFKKPVDYAVVNRPQIKQVLARKLAETFSEQEFAQISAAFSRLGLLPENYPLRQKFIDLLGEQVAAFYDQHSHKLFMFEDATLENAQNRVVLAHELTHALQDQHFNLSNLPLEIKDNDDRAMAASALVEGEATLVMSDYMMHNLSLQALKDNISMSLTQNMDQLRQAPRYLRETLVFPYLRGQEFCSALLEQGGYAAISKAYARLPESSAQILHPESYLANPPVTAQALVWPAEALAAAKPAVQNVLGEFGLRLLLEEAVAGAKSDLSTSDAEHIASGWRGDHYLYFNQGDILLWKTAWSTESAANRFLEAERGFLLKRYKPAAPHDSDGALGMDAPRFVRLYRATDNTVWLIDAADAEAAQRVQKLFSPERP